MYIKIQIVETILTYLYKKELTQDDKTELFSSIVYKKTIRYLYMKIYESQTLSYMDISIDRDLNGDDVVKYRYNRCF